MAFPLADYEAIDLIRLDLLPEELPLFQAAARSLWKMNAPKEALGAGLQYWYTRRGILDSLMGANRRKVNVQSDKGSFALQQRFSNLAAMRDLADQEIQRIESRSRNRLGSVSPASTLPDAYADDITVRSLLTEF